jgi:hypothetical protein
MKNLEINAGTDERQGMNGMLDQFTRWCALAKAALHADHNRRT